MQADTEQRKSSGTRDTKAANESIAEETSSSTNQNKPVTNGYILRHSRDQYAAICNYLQELGFHDIAFTGPTQSIKSNWSNLGDLIFDTFSLLRYLNRYRRADILFSIGNATIPLKLFMKLGFIKCRKLFWFGFFLHSPKSFLLFRNLSKLLSHDNERYIVFSKWERSLYSRELSIPLSRLIYIPWGSWNEQEEGKPPRTAAGQKGGYYFAGGASNRDYLSLVEVFRNRPDKLVIVCSSKKNNDLLSVQLPSNIVVHTDLNSKEFGELVQGARACILTLKHNTGASGQSVLLRYMRQAKAIIATNTDVVREYLESEISGILIKEPLTELSAAIEKLDRTPELSKELGDAARKRFLTTFSRQAVSKALRRTILDESVK